MTKEDPENTPLTQGRDLTITNPYSSGSIRGFNHEK